MTSHRILSDGQKCSNSDRNIFEATLALKDKIAQMIAHRKRGKLIGFDLQSAFDRVRRPYLHQTMCALGINRDFVDLLARISDRSTSRLLVNGHLSPAFEIQRSVRQGDPLSMHLFVLYLHPLLSHLERVCGVELVVAYADDISVIATSANQIDTMHELFSRFGQISGAKLNVSKTTSIDVGFINGDPIFVPWLQTANTIKILGVIFANSIRLMIKLNWDALVAKFGQHIWLHSLRTLTIHQKVTLVNTFLTAKIWYISSVLPPYSVHSAKITSVIGTYLWKNLPARVPIQQLARSREQGGLKLQLPAFKCKSLLINRHVNEIESMPYYKSFIYPDNPNSRTLPSDLPCLKIISQNLPLLPPQIQQNPSADLIHNFYLEQTEPPKVERNSPAGINWRRAWANIAERQLTAAEKSQLYLFTNEKTSHRKLMFVLRRVENESCLHCNEPIETLRHKFCGCSRVAEGWNVLQQKIAEKTQYSAAS